MSPIPKNILISAFVRPPETGAPVKLKILYRSEEHEPNKRNEFKLCNKKLMSFHYKVRLFDTWTGMDNVQTKGIFKTLFSISKEIFPEALHSAALLLCFLSNDD